MAFPCPGCQGVVDRSPVAWLLRCPSCGRPIRSRAVEGGRDVRAFEVEIVGRPQTRRRVELPWSEADRRRLDAWLLWSSAITMGLVAVLYVLARWLR